MVPKPNKDSICTQKEKLQTEIIYKHECKNSNILGNGLYCYTKKVTNHNQLRFISRIQGWFTIRKLININHLISLKKKTMNISKILKY